MWRPSDVSSDARLPVYLFIHGGSLMEGASNIIDMTGIVEKTGVIGVSFNYRLGVLGFFSHPDVVKDSGDFGSMDQQAALRWVHDNIAAFGGDPARVTLGGQSAGGWSVCAHLAAPGSVGLFAQAMMQSGSCISILRLKRKKTPARSPMRSVQRAGRGRLPAFRSGGQALDVPYPGGSPYLTDETSLLPVAPRKAVSDGSFPHVAIVIGATRDEGREFQQGSIGWQQADYAEWVNERFRADPTRSCNILAQERGPVYGRVSLRSDRHRDSGPGGLGGCPTLKLTQTLRNAYLSTPHEFGHRTGPGNTRRARRPTNGGGPFCRDGPLSSSLEPKNRLRCYSTPASARPRRNYEGFTGRIRQRGSPARGTCDLGRSSTLQDRSYRCNRTIGLSCFRRRCSAASTTANSEEIER